ncbi:hypothetical protein Tco_0837973 [Tanacetum coccineum]
MGCGDKGREPFRVRRGCYLQSRILGQRTKRRMPTNVKTYDGIGDPDWLSMEETPATRIPPNAPRRPTNFVTEEVPETNEVGNPDFSWEEFAAKYCDNLAPFITPSTGANRRRSLLSRLSFDHEQPDLFSTEEESGDQGNRLAGRLGRTLAPQRIERRMQEGEPIDTINLDDPYELEPLGLEEEEPTNRRTSAHKRLGAPLRTNASIPNEYELS